MTRPSVRSRASLFVLGAASLVAGCATATSGVERGSSVYGHESISEPTAWVDGRTGKELSAGEALARLREARVVLVGEAHGTASHHALQAFIAGALNASGQPSAAAVEWLPHSARFAVAGWLRSAEPVDAFFDAIGWARLWGHAAAAYAPFFDAMRAAGIPVVPVNAEPGLARAVARGTELSPEDAARLPPLDSGTDAHRRWFFAQMTGLGSAHGHGGAHGQGHDPERLERMYRAQLVWDETMARHVRALAERYATVVVCAGTGHTTRGLGIPARLGGLPARVVHPASSVDEAQSRSVDGDFPDREADLFAIVPDAR